MRRTIIAAASLILLAACDNSAEPAPPPTSQDALTTATTAPPTPSDEVEVTTDAAPTTEEPAEAESQGPPEMPDEAREQTEAGAEAFARHYLDLINYTGRSPEEGLLEPLASDGCASCRQHEDSVAYGVENGDYLEQDTFKFGDASSIFTENSSRVSIPVEQVAQTYLRNGEPLERTLSEDRGNLVVRVVWADGWLVDEITVER